MKNSYAFLSHNAYSSSATGIELNRRLNSRKSDHISPSQVGCGTHCVRIWEKTDRISTVLHCISYMSSKTDDFLWRVLYYSCKSCDWCGSLSHNNITMNPREKIIIHHFECGTNSMGPHRTFVTSIIFCYCMVHVDLSCRLADYWLPIFVASSMILGHPCLFF